MATLIPPTTTSPPAAEKVDYLNLPCPIPYEEVHREALKLPSQSTETIKIPTAHYEFGVNFMDPKLMLFGTVMTDGRVNARVKCDLSENLTLKANTQGKDHRSQFQLGNGALFGASYIQVATGQVASSGMVALSYVQKVSEKVSLASDFMYNYMSRDVTASFGYDYILRFPTTVFWNTKTSLSTRMIPRDSNPHSLEAAVLQQGLEKSYWFP